MSGFSIVPNWLIRESDLDAHELLVYLALLNRVNKFGRAWPSMKTIAREARCSESSVRRTLASLGQRGLVTVERRPQEGRPNLSNVYRVTVFDREGPGERGGFHPGTLGSRRDGKEGATETPEVDPSQVDPDEVEVRSDLQADRTRAAAAGTEISVDQRIYLRDLWIHFYNDVPGAAQEKRFSGLTRAQASDAIAQLLRDMPRHSAYEGPEPGDPAYEALSAVGREFADRGMLPDGAGGIR